MNAYIVLNYLVKPSDYNNHSNEDIDIFNKYNLKKNIKNLELSDICIFLDQESAIIYISRKKEFNSFKNNFITLKKINISVSDEDLRDDNNIYAILDYEDSQKVDNWDYFQDEINAEIHKLAKIKVEKKYLYMLKIPLSEKLRLTIEGNFTTVPKTMNFLNPNELKKYLF